MAAFCFTRQRSLLVESPLVASGSCRKARSGISCYFARTEAYAVDLAQTSDHLSVSRPAGDSRLLPGSGVPWRRRRQLDHARFPGAYLLDLHHVARHPHHPKFNWRRVISQVRSIAHSPLVNGAFCDSARRRLFLLRKGVARTGHLQSAANFNGETEVVLFARRSRSEEHTSELQ